MSEQPKSLSIFEEGPEQAPLSAFNDTASEQNKSDKVSDKKEDKVPAKMFSDETAEAHEHLTVLPEKSNKVVHKEKETNAASSMLGKIMKYMESNNSTYTPSIAPAPIDVVLNDDSTLNVEETEKHPLEDLTTVTEGLLNAFSELKKVSQIDSSLDTFEQAESTNVQRDQVYIHFMINGIVVDEYSGFVGDKLNLPSIDTIKNAMGSSWDSSQFIGWDSDGIAHNNQDIKAILKKTFPVSIFIHSNKVTEISVAEGTKVLKAVEQCIESQNLVLPLLSNYSVYCTTKIITGPCSINLEPKTDAAKARHSDLGKAAKVLVVFAIKPSDLNLDVNSMTREELKKATIIQKVTVTVGDSVEPPTDDVLIAHGLRVPFDDFYTWSNSLDNITSNTVIKALPKSVIDHSEKVINDIRNMSSDELFDSGKELLKQAVSAIKYPALLYIEHKLMKEFEAGRQLKTRDFIFLKHSGELMLYKYTGVKSEIEIPAVVNGLYVKYIHPKAFSRGPFRPWYIFNKHKLFSTERFGSAAGNMTALILPVTIKYLPANFLYNVAGVDTLVIPESVNEISPNAFSGSSIQEIYFDGACPKGFTRDNVTADVFVRRGNYKSFFA